ncbi:MAG: ABC transporter permease [Chloroflexi bacterium]|nr:ABC transporter permease [Chloroflexota bacterium]
MRRIGILLIKEFTKGSRGFLFIFAIVVPVVITLLVSLLVGTIFSGKAKLGLTAEGDSQVIGKAMALESVIVKEYDTAVSLRDAVQRGSVDLGVVLPAGFDDAIKNDGIKNNVQVEIAAYVWGESQLKNRAVSGTALFNVIRDIIGEEAPAEIIVTQLGDEAPLPWDQRLMPFIVLMTVLIGSIMIPATSVVEEKQNRTLSALTITPVSLGELFIAKGLMGVILGMIMAAIILLMNNAFGSHPGLLLFILFLGGVFASTFGVLLGALIKDINTLFATIKGMGIFLYAPAIIYLFPSIPQWIGKIFPTYYIVQPVVEITQQGGTWLDVAPELGILVVLIAALMGVVTAVIRSARQQKIIGLNAA